MASSVCGKDELNPVLRLATVLTVRRHLARSGIPTVSREKIVFFFHIIYHLLAKLIRYR